MELLGYVTHNTVSNLHLTYVGVSYFKNVVIVLPF